MRSCGKYCTVGQTTDANIIWPMRFAYWIPKATITHSECVTHFFSMATLVTRTHHSVTSYAHCCLATIHIFFSPISFDMLQTFTFSEED